MVFVYKDNGEKQCGEGRPPISLDEMAKSLKGIKILSQSIKNDGMMRPSMCGASTGAINVYEINPADLKKALDLGFNQYKPE